MQKFIFIFLLLPNLLFALNDNEDLNLVATNEISNTPGANIVTVNTGNTITIDENSSIRTDLTSQFDGITAIKGVAATAAPPSDITITNNGTIQAYDAIELSNVEVGARALVTNTSIINGNITFPSNNVLPNQLNNSGAIIGAIKAGQASDVFTFTDGSVTGTITGQGNNLSLSNDAEVTGDVSNIGTFLLDNTSKITGNVNIATSLTLNNDTEITGDVNTVTTLTINDNAKIGGSIDSATTLTFGAGADYAILNAISNFTNCNVNRKISIDGANLNGTGASIFSNNSEVTLSLNRNITTNTFNNTGILNLDRGNLSIAGTLTNTGTVNVQTGETGVIAAVFASRTANSQLTFDITDTTNTNLDFQGVTKLELGDTNVKSKVQINQNTSSALKSKYTLIKDMNAASFLRDYEVLTNDSAVVSYGLAIEDNNLNLVINKKNYEIFYKEDESNNTLATVLSSLETLNNTDISNYLGYIENSTSKEEVISKVNQLAPSGNESIITASLNNQNQFIEVVSNRLSFVKNERNQNAYTSGDIVFDTNLWGQTFLKHIKQTKRNGIDGFKSYLWGLALGIDYEYSYETTVGISTSYATSKVRGIDKNRNTANVDSYQVSMYGLSDPKVFFLEGIASYSMNRYNQKRLISTQNGNSLAISSYNGNQYGLKVTLGKKYQHQNKTFKPAVIAMYNFLKNDDYKESNVGDLGLKIINDDRIQSLILGAGSQIEYTFDGMNISPYFKGFVYHDLRAKRQVTLAKFNAGGPMFTTLGMKPSKTSANLGAGFLFKNDNLLIDGNLEYEIKEKYRGILGIVKLKYRI